MSGSLGIRFAVAVVALVLLPVLALTGRSAYLLWTEAGDASRRSVALAVRGDALKLTETASALAESMDRFLIDRIGEAQAWASSRVVASAVHRVRQEHVKQGLDDLSIVQLEERFRVDKTLGLARGAEAYLREQVRMSPHFAEVFFTDRQGYNVALTNPTSDFVQSDEEWWQRAWSSGFSIGEVQFDESADVWSVDLSVRIQDPRTDTPIGVMKAVLSIRFVQLFADRLAERLSAPGQLLHPQVAATAGTAGGTQVVVGTGDGRLVAETRSGHARGRIMRPEINLLAGESVGHLNPAYKGRRSGAFIAEGPEASQSSSYLVAFARSGGPDVYSGTVRDFPGFDWIVIVEAANLSGLKALPGVAEVQGLPGRAVSGALWTAAVMSVWLMAASVLLCRLFGQWVLVPARMLTDRVRGMEEGQISHEIGLSSEGELADLAKALDRIRQMIAKMVDRRQRAASGSTQPPERDGTRRSGAARP